jgi:5,5'-dehydrodivanillate O-demethylase oxygenase subunit
MLTKKQNERLTRVGPGTPCGELMRRYWHPIAASAQLPEPGTRRVRILGEDLVLFRDHRGRLGLLPERCAHRGAPLLYGIPDAAGLRCTYHGWVYDPSGHCVEQPYETFVDPKSDFRQKVGLKAYPVEELGGLIFVYLGPEPRPLLPRWEAYVRDDLKREIGWAVIPCNWLQTVENAGDSSHVVSTHWQFSHYVFQKLGRPDLQRHADTSGGLGRYPPRHGKERRHWAGMGGVVFPYLDSQNDCYQIRVPLDDTHTLHVWYMFYTLEDEALLGVEIPPQPTPFDVPVFEVPVPALNPDGSIPWEIMDGNSSQDLVMWYGQGEIMDRSQEHLGLGDTHIIQLRKLLDEQIRVVAKGGDPLNTFRDPAANVCLEPPVKVRMPPKVAEDGRPDLTNAARKYSPAYRAAYANRCGQEALGEPVH